MGNAQTMSFKTKYQKKFTTDLFKLQSTEEVEISKKKKEVFAQIRSARLKYVLSQYLDYKYWVSLGNIRGNSWDGRKGSGRQTIHGGSGDDTLFGGSGKDDLLGQEGNDRLYGMVGNDYLSGDDGDDRLSGGKGSDELHGGRGNDVLYGGAGRDTLDGGSGNDKLYGGNSNDRLYGDTGRDTLLGDKGNDYLSGENGKDVLDGGVGRDTLEGGRGADIFMFSTSLDDKNIDLILDLDKNDQIQLKKSLVDKLDVGILSERHFVANTYGRSFDKDDYIIYNTKTGALYYDADANKMKCSPVQIATISQSDWQLKASQICVVG